MEWTVGTLRSRGGRGVPCRNTHNVGRLSAHPNHGAVDPSQQPLHYQLDVYRSGALWGKHGN